MCRYSLYLWAVFLGAVLVYTLLVRRFSSAIALTLVPPPRFAARKMKTLKRESQSPIQRLHIFVMHLFLHLMISWVVVNRDENYE